MKILRAPLLLVLLSVSPVLGTSAGDDLGRIYAGKLDYEKDALGRDWSSGPEDVWSVASFEYAFEKKLEIELGPSTVVFGKHGTKKSGHSVVWAVVIPETPAPFTCSSPGSGERIKSIFLRFHPSLVRELFPAKSVLGQGPGLALIAARRVYRHKINGHWQSENMPVVPWKHALVFDIETVESKRRCYMLDGRAGNVEYVQAFAERRLPDPPMDPIDQATATAAFDAAWEAFDVEYAMFTVKPEVDWPELRSTYRPLAEQATTSYEAAGVIALLLAELEDLHVAVKVGDLYLPGFNRMRMLNANWQWMKGQFDELHETDGGIAWGKLEGGLGYINVWNLSNSELTDTFDQALEGLADTRGLIVDLRFNGGGDELLGRAIAGRFVDDERVYSVNRYRSGKKHDRLGPRLQRKVEPRGPWGYEAPVVALFGQKTMSSAESLALMLAQCPQVTTMGDRTAGSSANPRWVEVPGGIEVKLPRWLDMDPDENPIDRVGIRPTKVIDAPSYADFKERDPVFEAALKWASKKKGRKPGKRQ